MTRKMKGARPPRTPAYVVDASAAAKQFLAEPEQDALLDWLKTARLSGSSLLAPTLLRYELGNVMATQVRRGVAWSPDERATLLDQALLGFSLLDPQGAEASAPPLTYYDAAYLALAKATQAALVTYDDRLAEAAKEAGIEVVGPGV